MSCTERVVRWAARMKRRASMMTWPMRYSTSWVRLRSASSERVETPTDSAQSLTDSGFQRYFMLSAFAGPAMVVVGG